MKRIYKNLFIIFVLIIVCAISVAILVGCGGSFNADSVSISDYSTDNYFKIKVKCETFHQPKDQLVKYNYRGKKTVVDAYSDIVAKLPENCVGTIDSNLCYIKRDNGDGYSYFVIYDNKMLCNQSILYKWLDNYGSYNYTLVLIPIFYFDNPSDILSNEYNRSSGSGDYFTPTKKFAVNADVDKFAEFYNSISNTSSIISDNVLTVTTNNVNKTVKFAMCFDNEFVNITPID